MTVRCNPPGFNKELLAHITKEICKHYGFKEDMLEAAIGNVPYVVHIGYNPVCDDVHVVYTLCNQPSCEYEFITEIYISRPDITNPVVLFSIDAKHYLRQNNKYSGRQKDLIEDKKDNDRVGEYHANLFSTKRNSKSLI